MTLAFESAGRLHQVKAKQVIPRSAPGAASGRQLRIVERRCRAGRLEPRVCDHARCGDAGAAPQVLHGRRQSVLGRQPAGESVRLYGPDARSALLEERGQAHRPADALRGSAGQSVLERLPHHCPSRGSAAGAWSPADRTAPRGRQETRTENHAALPGRSDHLGLAAGRDARQRLQPERRRVDDQRSATIDCCARFFRMSAKITPSVSDDRVLAAGLRDWGLPFVGLPRLAVWEPIPRSSSTT